MALFNKPVPRQRPYFHPAKNHALPTYFQHLRQAVCHDHFGPVPMKYIGLGASKSGQTVAIYACPVCNTRQGWVQDYRTGKPYCLFNTPGT